jgi:putative transposase
MSFRGYKITNNKSIYFISFAIVGWVDVFTRKDYSEILVESLKYCQEHKGLVLYAWCIMSNHVHLIASARNGNLSDMHRDLKSFTSKKIVSAIESHNAESRKEWMLSIFKRYGNDNSRNTNYQFWQQENAPIECFTPDFTNQKLIYLHNNPVAAGIVIKAEDYYYSSARAYRNQRNNGIIDVVFLE